VEPSTPETSAAQSNTGTGLRSSGRWDSAGTVWARLKTTPTPHKQQHVYDCPSPALRLIKANSKVTGQKLPLTLAPSAHTSPSRCRFPPERRQFERQDCSSGRNVNRGFSVLLERPRRFFRETARLNPSMLSFGNTVQIGRPNTNLPPLSNSGILPVTVTRAASHRNRIRPMTG